MDFGNSSAIHEIVKLDKFDGCNYTRWAEKVTFKLQFFKLYHIMNPDTLSPIPADPIPEVGKELDLNRIDELNKLRIIRKEETSLACGHIKNSLSDRLFDLYSPISDPIELWKAVENKYKTHEEGTNKYLVSKYLRFLMVDDKPIMEQIHELQVISNKMKILSITLPEIFLVGAVIDKLPPSWKDFSKRMMHRSEDYSLDDLLKHIRIEEETRNRDKRGKSIMNVNHVQGGNMRGKGKGGGSKWNQGPQKKIFKRSGFQPKPLHNGKRTGKCHVCGEIGHYARECKDRKSNPLAANSVIELNNLVANLTMDEIDMVVEERTRARGGFGWFLDSGATVHVCDSRSKYTEYRPVKDGKKVMTANGGIAEIAGIGTVLMKFSSGKTLTLRNVLHVPTIRKCLVSLSKLDENGIGMALESGKIVFHKRQHFIGRAYRQFGMYRMCLRDEGDGAGSSASEPETSNALALSENSVSMIDVSVLDINETSFDYIACSISLWHKRLAHTNIKNIEKMQNKGLININNKDFGKCETCVKSKFTKKPFPAVKRDTTILELIHTDICELNGILT